MLNQGYPSKESMEGFISFKVVNHSNKHPAVNSLDKKWSSDVGSWERKENSWWNFFILLCSEINVNIWVAYCIFVSYRIFEVMNTVETSYQSEICIWYEFNNSCTFVLMGCSPLITIMTKTTIVYQTCTAFQWQR